MIKGFIQAKKQCNFPVTCLQFSLCEAAISLSDTGLSSKRTKFESRYTLCACHSWLGLGITVIHTLPINKDVVRFE